MNTRFIIILFIVAAIGFSSCKNNDNVFTPKLTAYYKIINGSADTLNYYLNGTRQNNGSSLVPGGAEFYLPVPVGSENFQFKKNGAADVLFSVPEKLDTANYSLYIAGLSVNQTFRTTDFFNPDTTQAIDTLTQARFVNASPDIGDLDVYIGDTLKYKSREFKSSSDFIIFGKGKKHVTVYLAGTKTPLQKDTSFVMSDHIIYTIYAYGLKNGKGASKFNVAFTLNYQ